MRHPLTRAVAALAIALTVSTGCSTNWSLGGLPGRNEPMARSTYAYGSGYAYSGSRGSSFCSGGSGIGGGAPELLMLVCMGAAIGVIALAAEGVRRLFGGST